MTAPSLTAAPLLALDPDLGSGLDPDQLPEARRALVVRVARLPEGDWRPRLGGSAAALGLLLVDGLVVRQVECAGGTSAEVLGAGDVIRPWQRDDESLIESTVSWFVAEEPRIAILDGALAAALAAWPQIAAELMARALRRSRWAALQRSIGHVRRLDQRTLLCLWHLGERFGRVTNAGIAVRVPLTHERLAAIVGAHRPSLTSSLRSLEGAGLLVRGRDGAMLLTPAARAAVARLASRSPAIAA